MTLSRLEGARHRGLPLEVGLDGQSYTLPTPQTLSLDEISVVYGTKGLSLWEKRPPALTARKAGVAFDLWLAHHDLPSQAGLERLCWMLDRYLRSIEYDLYTIAGVDVMALWAERRWTALLTLVDLLPLNTRTQESLHTDHEYAAMVAQDAAKRARDKDKDAAPVGPPLSRYSQEAEILLKVVDGLKAVQSTIVAVNLPAGKAAPKVTPEPRPTTAHKMEREEQRRKSHDSLTARLVPGGG